MVHLDRCQHCQKIKLYERQMNAARFLEQRDFITTAQRDGYIRDRKAKEYGLKDRSDVEKVCDNPASVPQENNAEEQAIQEMGKTSKMQVIKNAIKGEFKAWERNPYNANTALYRHRYREFLNRGTLEPSLKEKVDEAKAINKITEEDTKHIFSHLSKADT